MPIGYLGYAKIGDPYGSPSSEIFLLCNSTGLNRQVNPLLSTAVWGAGWYTAAQHTNYADSQMSFEGAINFELSGNASIWNLVANWLIENRAYAKSCTISPNGFAVYSYTLSNTDSRSGAWCKSCSFTIDAGALVTVAATAVALKRTESGATGTNYAANKRDPGNAPANPLNPDTRNMNPIPGWNVTATVAWPNSQTFWADTNDTTRLGMVLMKATVNVNNNTQVIRGCTGDLAPVAVIQGVIHAEGNMELWRNGGIPDPYGTPGNFTATGASIGLAIGSGAGALAMDLDHVLLTSDAYDVQGQNNPSNRNFGFAGLGDGTAPPITMDLV
jgi:hypothetical protein